MIAISKDDSERVVEQFLISLSKENGSQKLAVESMNVLNDKLHKAILLGSLLRTYKDSLKDIDNGEFQMRVCIMSALNCIFDEDCDLEEMPPKFAGLFASEDDDLAWNNPKLQFAVDQFVSAFYTYELFENKYPNIADGLKIVL